MIIQKIIHLIEKTIHYRKKEKLIKENEESIRTGYLNGDDFILHSFDDEPALIYKDGTKYWCKDSLVHRDNHKPAIKLV